MDSSDARTMLKSALKNWGARDYGSGVELTTNGLVRDDADAESTIRLFEDEGIDGLIIVTMISLTNANVYPQLIDPLLQLPADPGGDGHKLTHK